MSPVKPCQYSSKLWVRLQDLNIYGSYSSKLVFMENASPSVYSFVIFRYFTWDQHRFSHPLEMTANLTARGRKLVTIVDPHIKRDHNYFFYKENHDRDLFVHTKDGNEFDGEMPL